MTPDINSLTYRTRSEIARDSRDARLRGWFAERRWRVVTEISGERIKVVDHVRVVTVFDRGEFWITSEQGVFQTPFGYKGRHGFLIEELTEIENPRTTPLQAAFGHGVLAKAQKLFSCFPDGLPAPRRQPPRSA